MTEDIAIRLLWLVAGICAGWCLTSWRLRVEAPAALAAIDDIRKMFIAIRYREMKIKAERDHWRATALAAWTEVARLGKTHEDP